MEQAPLFGIWGLCVGVKYHLVVEVKRLEQKSDGAEGSGVFLMKEVREFFVNRDVGITPLTLNVPWSGKFSIELFLQDQYPGLEDDQQTLAHVERTVMFPLDLADEAIRCGDAIVIGWSEIHNDEAGPVALVHRPLLFRDSPSLRRSNVPQHVASLRLVTLKLVEGSAAKGAGGEGCGSEMILSKPRFREEECDESGEVRVFIDLPRRHWCAGTYSLQLDFSVDKTGIEATELSRMQLLQLHAPLYPSFIASGNLRRAEAGAGFGGRGAGGRDQAPVSWCDVMTSSKYMPGKDGKAPEVASAWAAGGGTDTSIWPSTIVTGFWSPTTFQVKKREEEAYWPWLESLWSVTTPVVIFASASTALRLRGMGNWCVHACMCAYMCAYTCERARSACDVCIACVYVYVYTCVYVCACMLHGPLPTRTHTSRAPFSIGT